MPASRVRSASTGGLAALARTGPSGRGGVTTSSKNAKDQPTNPCASFKLGSSTSLLQSGRQRNRERCTRTASRGGGLPGTFPSQASPLRDGRDDGEADRDLGGGDERQPDPGRPVNPDRGEHEDAWGEEPRRQDDAGVN